MLKASEIRIVVNTDSNQAQEEINRLLSKDWALHGDLKVVHSSSGLSYTQALVRLMAFEPPGVSAIAQPGGPMILGR
jgi:hypothetical protein